MERKPEANDNCCVVNYAVFCWWHGVQFQKSCQSVWSKLIGQLMCTALLISINIFMYILYIDQWLYVDQFVAQQLDVQHSPLMPGQSPAILGSRTTWLSSPLVWPHLCTFTLAVSVLNVLSCLKVLFDHSLHQTFVLIYCLEKDFDN